MNFIQWDNYSSENIRKTWDYFRLSEPRMNDVYGKPSDELINRNNMIELTAFIVSNQDIYNFLKPYFETMITNEPTFHVRILANVLNEHSILIQKVNKYIVFNTFDVSQQINDILVKNGKFGKYLSVRVGKGFYFENGNTIKQMYDYIEQNP